MMDMYFWTQQLRQTIGKEQWKQAVAIASRMRREMGGQVFLPAEKQTALGETQKTLDQFMSDAGSSSVDAAVVNQRFGDFRESFYSVFGNTVVYLLRHPEKTSQKGRVLAEVGVKQAHAYAQQLIDEVLFCPKNVTVGLYTSEIERTKKYAQLVAYELKKLGELQGRQVRIDNGGFDYRLGFRFSKEEIDFLGKSAEQKGIKADGGFAQFSEWLSNADSYLGQFPKLHHPAVIVRELQDFVDWHRRQFTTNANQWSVVLGFTHSWILDALRVHYAGKDVKEIVKSGGFVKIDGGKINVDGVWYNYA